MYGASQALVQNSASSPKMPTVKGLQPLYDIGCSPRQGELVMIAGRSGSMKSTFALWLVDSWGKDTLYFSADMSPFQASTKLASKRMGKTVEDIEEQMKGEGAAEIQEVLSESKVRFSFGSPVKWRTLYAELNAWVTLYGSYPSVIVIDNLQDVEESESDYAAQMFAMQTLSDLSRATGASVLVLHHASDKSWEADSRPYRPPSRKEVKNGMSEKPELSLGVAFNGNSNEFNVAVIKQRMGPQDPTANSYATLGVVADRNLFYDPRIETHLNKESRTNE